MRTAIPAPSASVMDWPCMWARLCAGLILSVGIFVPGGALAQDAGLSRPVVQALPSREALQLNAALSRLGRNPRDKDALVDAGDAASSMGDYEAAIGFYKRAQQISKDDGRVKAGLAGAFVQNGDPFTAIPLFAEAERAGVSGAKLAGNRGLAYDLVGDTATAQRFYQMALKQGSDDEISRRLAISLAISGDERGVERTLLPLLRRQNKAAWRTRAFSLAILGKTKESVKITKTLLPGNLADGISPYLQYMPRLTAAQQAAAANLGQFPRASEIGLDDPRVAQFAPRVATPPKVASVEAGLVPAGRQLGDAPAVQREVTAETIKRQQASEARAAKKAARDAKRTAVRKSERIAPPEPNPGRQAGSANEPVLAVAELPAQTAVAVAPAPAAPTRPDEPAPAAAASPANVSPGFDLANLPKTAVSSEPVEREPAAAKASVSFSDMFVDLGKPVAEAVPAAGAVDIRAIKPAKPQPKAVPSEPKPEQRQAAPPSHPSRIWVQLGIGQKTSALRFDWRRIERKAPELFKGLEAYSSTLNATNRMLTGPFQTIKAANEFVAGLRKAGIDGPYVWTSPAGQVVDAL